MRLQVETELSPVTETNLVVEDSDEDMLIMMRAMGMAMITSAHWRHTAIALPRSLQERKLRI